MIRYIYIRRYKLKNVMVVSKENLELFLKIFITVNFNGEKTIEMYF
jgi:hypothetical protein